MGKRGISNPTGNKRRKYCSKFRSWSNISKVNTKISVLSRRWHQAINLDLSSAIWFLNSSLEKANIITMWPIAGFKLFLIFRPHTYCSATAQQGNICINMGKTMHSLHGFIFDSDPEHLITDYGKAHTSLSLLFFLEPKKYLRKLGGTFLNVMCFWWERAQLWQRQVHWH